MSATFAGTITEDMRGEELARLVNEHWGVSARSTVFFDELAHGCKSGGLSAENIVRFFEGVNEYRGCDEGADVLGNAFVPEANMQAVCALLDEIQGLCVCM